MAYKRKTYAEAMAAYKGKSISLGKAQRKIEETEAIIEALRAKLDRAPSQADLNNSKTMVEELHERNVTLLDRVARLGVELDTAKDEALEFEREVARKNNTICRMEDAASVHQQTIDNLARELVMMKETTARVTADKDKLTDFIYLHLNHLTESIELIRTGAASIIEGRGDDSGGGIKWAS